MVSEARFQYFLTAEELRGLSPHPSSVPPWQEEDDLDDAPHVSHRRVSLASPGESEVRDFSTDFRILLVDVAHGLASVVCIMSGNGTGHVDDRDVRRSLTRFPDADDVHLPLAEERGQLRADVGAGYGGTCRRARHHVAAGRANLPSQTQLQISQNVYVVCGNSILVLISLLTQKVPNRFHILVARGPITSESEADAHEQSAT